jgi:hypothetical protein
MRLTVLFLFLFNGLFSYCQSENDTLKFSKFSFLAGIYGSYIWDNYNSSSNPSGLIYNELSVGSRIFAFYKHIGLGFQYTNIFTNSNYYLPEKFTLFGPLIQYKASSYKRIQGYVDMGFLRGNYCLCDIVPIKKSNLNYLSTGLGAYIELFEKTYLEIGYATAFSLNNPDNKFYYNLYRVGLSYIFSPLIKERKPKNPRNVRFL